MLDFYDQNISSVLKMSFCLKIYAIKCVNYEPQINNNFERDILKNIHLIFIDFNLRI